MEYIKAKKGEAVVKFHKKVWEAMGENTYGWEQIEDKPSVPKPTAEDKPSVPKPTAIETALETGNHVGMKTTDLQLFVEQNSYQITNYKSMKMTDLFAAAVAIYKQLKTNEASNNSQ